jgi:hypothetical protein
MGDIFTKAHIDKIYDKQLEAVLSDAETEGPTTPEDRANPHIIFHALARTYVELGNQATKNTAYYASGRCGGCETCGLPPYPDLLPSDWTELRTRMKQAIEDIERRGE